MKKLSDHKKTIAVSVGDLNGIGIEIALRTHAQISKIAKPIYCISEKMLAQTCKKLHIKKPKDMMLYPVKGEFKIKPGKIDKKSGLYSFLSFKKAVKLCEIGLADAVVTLPIHKEAWAKAGIEYKGHTDMLRSHFKKEAIMVLGCENLYVALFTEHIPLQDVPKKIKTDNLFTFFLNLSKEKLHLNKIAVLGLNPHAGDGGVLGDEEKKIKKAIKKANKKLNKELFVGPMVPDTAFTENMLKKYGFFIAMYHDQGLAPLKALYFDESINISLNLPIVRSSVDHGTAFDIAYCDKLPSNNSYINAVKAAIILNVK